MLSEGLPGAEPGREDKERRFCELRLLAPDLLPAAYGERKKEGKGRDYDDRAQSYLVPGHPCSFGTLLAFNLTREAEPSGETGDPSVSWKPLQAKDEGSAGVPWQPQVHS